MITKTDIFQYYCLDKIKPITEEIYITYKDDGLIRKHYFKIGLKAKIKKRDCFLLYTSTDDDLDELSFISVDNFYSHFQRLATSVISKQEFTELVQKLRSINIFEFASLLDFMYIYDDFRKLILYNWEVLKMDNLIEN